MNLNSFSIANAVRCEAKDGFNHKISSWSLSDWITATAGELGEAANIVKKLNRIRDGIGHLNRETEEELWAELAKEIADTFCYLDLLATAAGFSLQRSVIDKWDEVSERIGYHGRLRHLPAGTIGD